MKPHNGTPVSAQRAVQRRHGAMVAMTLIVIVVSVWAQEQESANRELESALTDSKPVRNLTADEEARLKEATRKVLCSCQDCPPTLLDDCICPTARRLKDELKEKLLNGVAPDILVRQYVAQYGGKYLAAPPKEGFNMVIWVFPAIAFVALSLLFWWGLQRLARKPVRAHGSAPTQVVSQYQAEIERELNRRKV